MSSQLVILKIFDLSLHPLLSIVNKAEATSVFSSILSGLFSQVYSRNDKAAIRSSGVFIPSKSAYLIA